MGMPQNRKHDVLLSSPGARKQNESTSKKQNREGNNQHTIVRGQRLARVQQRLQQRATDARLHIVQRVAKCGAYGAHQPRRRVTNRPVICRRRILRMQTGIFSRVPISELRSYKTALLDAASVV